MLPVQLIQGSLSPDEGRFVGPVGIFNIFETVREQDASIAATEPERPNNLNTIGLLATLSVALGLTNLLPIPALDGGRILFVLPELILRRRIPARYENMIHFVGFVALILLMIYVTTQDIVNPITLP
jgi:regulator of sigma E protease